MTSAELAKKIIDNVTIESPQAFESLKLSVINKVTEYLKKEKALGLELVASEEIFNDTIVKIVITFYKPTGYLVLIPPVVANAIIAIAVKAILKKTEAYKKLKELLSK